MVKHTIRTAKGKIKEVEISRKAAIHLQCTECLGFEGSPGKDCTSEYCPLYPFRGKTLLSK